MVDIGADEALLLFQCWVLFGVALPRVGGVVVIVAPFCKVVCEFEAGGVGGGILKVDNDELLVGVLR